MFGSAAEQIRKNQDMLSQLDCIGGDGDHGTTMVRAMEVLEIELNAENDKSLQARLEEAGWSVLGVGGGASSALLGTLIVGMAEAELGTRRIGLRRPAVCEAVPLSLCVVIAGGRLSAGRGGRR